MEKFKNRLNAFSCLSIERIFLFNRLNGFFRSINHTTLNFFSADLGFIVQNNDIIQAKYDQIFGCFFLAKRLVFGKMIDETIKKQNTVASIFTEAINNGRKY